MLRWLQFARADEITSACACPFVFFKFQNIICYNHVTMLTRIYFTHNDNNNDNNDPHVVGRSIAG